MGIVGGIVGVNGAKTRAHVISLSASLLLCKTAKLLKWLTELTYSDLSDVVYFTKT